MRDFFQRGGQYNRQVDVAHSKTCLLLADCGDSFVCARRRGGGVHRVRFFVAEADGDNNAPFDYADRAHGRDGRRGGISALGSLSVGRRGRDNQRLHLPRGNRRRRAQLYVKNQPADNVHWNVEIVEEHNEVGAGHNGDGVQRVFDGAKLGDFSCSTACCSKPQNI